MVSSIAYIVDSDTEDLKVVDISDSSEASQIGSISIGGYPESIFVSGRYTYVVDSDTNDLKVIDVSDPGVPYIMGDLDIGGNPTSVFVSGRYAYVVDSDTDDLRIIDIGGAEVTSLIAHSLEAGNMQVQNDIIAQGQLQVTGGVNIGTGGLFSDGDIGINGSIYAVDKVGIGTPNPQDQLHIANGNFLQTPGTPVVTGSWKL